MGSRLTWEERYPERYDFSPIAAVERLKTERDRAAAPRLAVTVFLSADEVALLETIANGDKSAAVRALLRLYRRGDER